MSFKWHDGLDEWRLEDVQDAMNRARQRIVMRRVQETTQSEGAKAMRWVAVGGIGRESTAE
jgi:hypothetical protein